MLKTLQKESDAARAAHIVNAKLRATPVTIQLSIARLCQRGLREPEADRLPLCRRSNCWH